MVFRRESESTKKAKSPYIMTPLSYQEPSLNTKQDLVTETLRRAQKDVWSPIIPKYGIIPFPRPAGSPPQLDFPHELCRWIGPWR